MSDKKDEENAVDELVTKRLTVREKQRRENPNPLQQQALQNIRPRQTGKEEEKK